jgi:protein gp37
MSKAQKNRLTLAEALAGVLPKGKFWEKAWSLVEGCSHKSPGCDNCWLANMERRLGAKVEKGVTGNFQDGTISGFQKHTPSPLISGGNFNGVIRCREDRLSIPLKRQKPTVYAIWSDLMHEDVPDSFRDQAFATMAVASQHWFIIVTKRPEVAARYLSKKPLLPYDNVIILVTMEDQQRVSERGPWAMEIALCGWKVGALCEPLLGQITLTQIRDSGGGNAIDNALTGATACPGFADGLVASTGYSGKLSWVITGGESGHGARPAHPDWIRSLRDQAQVAQVPFMLKQLSGERGKTIKDISLFPADLQVRECPHANL